MKSLNVCSCQHMNEHGAALTNPLLIVKKATSELALQQDWHDVLQALTYRSVCAPHLSLHLLCNHRTHLSSKRGSQIRQGEVKPARYTGFKGLGYRAAGY